MQLRLVNFKCFVDETIEFRPLTIFTGVNSGGKTSIIQSLLLLKYFHDKASISAENQQLSWPTSAVGGIPVGDSFSFIRTDGASQTDLLLTEDNTTFCLSIPAEGANEIRQSGDLKCLTGLWRVASTIMLPLNQVQQIGNRDIDVDQIWDHCHALLEFKKFEFTRKVGSAAEHANLRSLVESILSIATSNTKIEISDTNIEGTIKLLYRGGNATSELTLPEQYGTGVTAALPLIIHLASSLKGETIICQDPEMHLHPRGQSLIGQEIAKCSVRGVRIIVETHSEHIINGIKLGLLNLGRDISEEMLCYFLTCENNLANLNRVEIDKRGLTRKWPKGFFDQIEVDLAALARQIH